MTAKTRELSLDDISFRVAKQEDLDNLKKLIDNTVDVSYKNSYSKKAINFFKKHHSKSAIKEDLKKEQIIVLEEKDKIIGTGTLAGNEIARVFITPKLQRNGLGKMIMEKLEERACLTGIQAVYLDASLSAYEFYQTLGYQTISEESIEVAKGEKLNYFKMRKKLKENWNGIIMN